MVPVMGDAFRGLLLEDDAAYAASMGRLLRGRGYELEHVESLAAARAALSTQFPEPYEILVFDLRLPDGNSLDLVRELRGRGDKAYVALLTAFYDRDDEAAALVAGADAYMSKRLPPHVVMARLDALMRRAREDAVSVGPLRFEPARRRLVWPSGALRVLSAHETRFLAALAERAGQTVSHEDLARSVWLGETRNRGGLSVLASRVRAHLGAELKQLIETMNRGGYRLVTRPAVVKTRVKASGARRTG